MIVQYGPSSFNIDINDHQNLSQLVSVLHVKTGVPPDHIKLIAQGKVIYPSKDPSRSSDDVSISDLLKGSNAKLLMIGNVSYDEGPSEVPRIKDDLTAEGRAHRGKYVIDANSLNGRALPVQTNYRFHSIRTLTSLPNEHVAREILSSLASDPGILAVLAKHKWSVGALCELYPEGYVGVSDVCVMGLNENHGQRILLRLRTDDLQGFRKPLTIRKVLYHELAHNVHSEHDDAFYILMRQIEREARELDWRQGRGRLLSSKNHHSTQTHTQTNSSASSSRHIVHTLGGGALLEATGSASASIPASLMSAAAAKSRHAVPPLYHPTDEPFPPVPPSIHGSLGDAGGEEEEEDMCCGCSSEHAHQRYMQSEEVEVSPPNGCGEEEGEGRLPADGMEEGGEDGNLSPPPLPRPETGSGNDMEEGGEEEGPEAAVTVEDEVVVATEHDSVHNRTARSAMVMQEVDTRIADAYVYLLEGTGGQEAATAQLEEKLPLLREAIQDVCLGAGREEGDLRDTLMLLRDIVDRALQVGFGAVYVNLCR